MIPAVLLGAALGAPRYLDRAPLEPADLRAPLPVQHIGVDGIDIAYIDSDPDGRTRGMPLVFIHGLSSYMGFWEHQIPALAQGRRVLALDLPGFGASGRPDAPYTPPWYAQIVDAWLGAVGVERAVVVGHSMGGQIAMTLTLDYPYRVGGLILSAPAGIETFSPGAAAWMKNYWTEGRAMEAREEEIRANFETLVFNRMDAGVERLIEERVRMMRTAAFRGTSVAVSRCIAGMLDHPVYQRLGQIGVPTLIVYGTDDHMIPNPVFTGGATRTVARRAQEMIPGSELLLIPGAGHTVHHDAPEQFNAAVTEFLERL